MLKKHLLKTGLLLCALIAGNSTWAADVVETLTIKGFGNYTTNSYSAAGTDYTGTGASSGVTYAMQVFNGSTGVPRGNQNTATSNFNCRNTTTYSGYYIKQVKLVRGSGSGTFDGSTSNRSVVYFGNTAYSNPNTTAPSGTSTASTENASNQTTLTWDNSDKTATYFILYNLKTSGTCSDCTIQITWSSTSTDPEIDASDIEFDCDETSGSIEFTVNNSVVDGILTAAKTTDADWLTVGEPTASSIPLTLTSNTGAQRTATVRLTYTYDTDKTVTKDIIVTQKLYVTKYNVNISAMTNGSVVSDVTVAAEYATVTLTITPSSGYKLSTITVTDADDSDVEINGSGNTRTFVMPGKAVTVAATFVRDYSITYDFAFDSMGTTDINGTAWGGSYAKHIQDFAGATVQFASASKQSGTITDIPVTKNSDVIITLTDANATFSSASFSLRHWSNKAVTITLYYSTDGGTNWTTTGYSYSFTADTNGEDVTLTASTLPSETNALKLLAGTNQQYGVGSATVEINSIISLNADCNDGGNIYGTYSNNLGFVVPEGLTVSAISIESGSTLAFDNYSTDDVVPANTGVIVSSTSAGDKTIILVNEAGTTKSGNKLLPSGDAGLSASDMDVTDTQFYRLTMHNGLTLGFWWGATDGAAFDITANKAYLAVPSTSAREGFLIGDDTVTSINEELRVKNEESNAAIYNLSGQRVTQPTKGLYIINRKKVLVK